MDWESAATTKEKLKVFSLERRRKKKKVGRFDSQ